jgi:signal transduction histidine kinase
VPADIAASAPWSEQAAQDALQIIAEGLTELVGFGMTVINIRRGEELVVVAVAGADGGRGLDGTEVVLRDMLGTTWPIARLEELLAVAESWGRFQFVPHQLSQRSSWQWVRPPSDVGGDDAWHPNDGALAPIHDGSGRLLGVISVDDPRTGRHPDAAQRRVMDKYAAEAAKVVVAALDREALEGRLRLAESARQVVRSAARHLSLDALIDETGPVFLEAFAATGLWLRIHGEADAMVTGLAGSRHELPVNVAAAGIAGTVTAAAEQLWERQQAAIVYSDGRARRSVLHATETDAIRRVVHDNGFGSVLHAPIGAGSECLGSLVLARDPGQPDWSDIELDQAAEIGRDLGRIIHNGQTYARVHDLVGELRDLDAHKSQLIAMVSHELKNPLTVLLANRDLLAFELEEDAPSLTRLAEIDANAQRMNSVVDNLLLLSKLADPDTPHLQREVDLRALLADVEEAFTTSMGRRGVSLRASRPVEPMMVRGDAGELRTMLANMIGNAIKFSDDGSSVGVELELVAGSVQVTIADDGIGISPDDQERLFTDFFRSQDPAALSRPGSGLGLAIVDRILRRHGGRAEVASALGQGTTVRVHLPSAPPPA